MSVKISALPATAAVLASDLYEKVDGGSGVSEKATITQLTTLLATLYQPKGTAIFNQTVPVTTQGAGFASQTWVKAPLNTVHVDTLSAFTLVSSVLTVTAAGAGTWKVLGLMPVIDFNTSPNNQTRCRVRRTNNTAATILLGQTNFSSAYMATNTLLNGVVTLAAGDTLEFQGWCQNATPQFGYYAGVSTGESEVYTVIQFERI